MLTATAAKTILEENEVIQRGLDPRDTETFAGAEGAKELLKTFREGQRLRIYYEDVSGVPAPVTFLRIKGGKAIVDMIGAPGVLGHLPVNVPFSWITAIEIL